MAFLERKEESLRKVYASAAKKWESVLKRNFFSDRVLKIEEVKNGYILPAIRKNDGRPGEYAGGVCNNQGEFVAGFYRTKNSPGYYGIGSCYQFDRTQIEAQDETVIYGGVIVGHFGHFILECMGRLWAVIKHPEWGYKIAFDFIKIRGNAGWIYDFFSLLDLPRDRILIITKPVKFSNIIIPEESVHSWYNYTKEYLLPYEYIKSKITPSPFKKIYLSRRLLVGKNVQSFNEEYFEEFFAERGYLIVEPERFNLKEQIALVSGADEIAAIIGSLTHWALFCKPGCKFYMIDRIDHHDDNDILGVQILVNQASKVDEIIIEGSKNFLPEDRSGGCVLLGANKYWREFVLDKFHEDVEDESWQKYCADYIREWCRTYSRKYKFEALVKKVDIEQIVHRLIYAFYDKEFEKIGLKEKDGRPVLLYSLHLRNIGWTQEKIEDSCDEGAANNPIEAVRIGFSKQFYEIYYATYANDKWEEYVSTGEIAGTVGKAQSIFGLRVHLDEEGQKLYRIAYRVYTVDNGWLPWVRDGKGSVACTPLTGIQIRIEKK